MSLAYALEAAINGSTGPRATLSHGLSRTKPRRRRSGPWDSHSSGWPRRPGTLSRKGAVVPGDLDDSGMTQNFLACDREQELFCRRACVSGCLGSTSRGL